MEIPQGTKSLEAEFLILIDKESIGTKTWLAKVLIIRMHTNETREEISWPESDNIMSSRFYQALSRSIADLLRMRKSETVA